MSQLNFRSLKITDIRQMYIAFGEAFANYAVNFSMSEEEFCQKFVEKLNIDFDLSVGVFDEGRLVGFVFSSIANYNDKLTVYNGGTGVIPEYRGLRISSRIYEYLIPKLREKGVKQCVLEVITTNVGAMKAYEQVGFVKSDYYHCFKLTKEPRNTRLNNKLQILKTENFDWRISQDFADFSSSFLDIAFLVKKNLKNEQLIVALEGETTVGYAVYQHQGRISRMSVSKKFRRRGIGAAMINFIFVDTGKKHLTLLNISKKEIGMLAFAKSAGFENKINQFEMVLALD